MEVRKVTCATLTGILMTALLVTASLALAQRPSPWTILAVLVLSFFNWLIWYGFGRALYDAYFRDWDKW